MLSCQTHKTAAYSPCYSPWLPFVDILFHSPKPSISQAVIQTVHMCVYVCMHTCMRVCMYVWMYVLYVSTVCMYVSLKWQG